MYINPPAEADEKSSVWEDQQNGQAQYLEPLEAADLLPWTAICLVGLGLGQLLFLVVLPLSDPLLPTALRGPTG